MADNEDKACVLCRGAIDRIGTPPHTWDNGHNAQPLADGRCCSDCNLNLVLPERIHRFRLSRKAVSALLH
jgi:hypothetical protein